MTFQFNGFDIALVLSVGWFILVMWLIWRAFRQQRAIRQVPPHAPGPAADTPGVAVIVPARDESANIGPCLRSLIAQHYPAERLLIVVVDDHSSDGTRDIVAALAREDPRITLLAAPPLPPGWQGKVNACCAGAAAVPADIGWLCFVDADMRAQPLLIASAMHDARGEGLDLLSLTPRHKLLSFAERLILPCGHYLLSFSQDLAKMQAPDSEDVTATGQFMLLRRKAYDAVRGHAAVCTAICEDLELARLIKQRGCRVLLKDGSRLISSRMYTGWSTLWPGIAKNLTELLGGPWPTVATAIAAVALAWAAVALPGVAILGSLDGSTAAAIAIVPAGLGALAAFALHLAGTRYFRIPLWYGLLFPVAYTAGAILAFQSLRWRLTGRIRWKGRVYP